MEIKEALRELEIASTDELFDFTDSDLRKRYRAIAKKCHPDVNKSGDEKFKGVTSAYELLQDVVQKMQQFKVAQTAGKEQVLEITLQQLVEAFTDISSGGNAELRSKINRSKTFILIMVTCDYIDDTWKLDDSGRINVRNEIFTEAVLRDTKDSYIIHCPLRCKSLEAEVQIRAKIDGVDMAKNITMKGQSLRYVMKLPGQVTLALDFSRKLASEEGNK